jgi:hypothetical protein
MEDLGKAMAAVPVPVPIWVIEMVEPHEIVRQMEQQDDFRSAPVTVRAARGLIIGMLERPGVPGHQRREVAQNGLGLGARQGLQLIVRPRSFIHSRRP